MFGEFPLYSHIEEGAELPQMSVPSLRGQIIVLFEVCVEHLLVQTVSRMKVSSAMLSIFPRVVSKLK